MSDRYDAVVIRSYVNRDGEEKTTFTKIGTAFPYRNSDGFMIRFDALPTGQLNDNGQLEVVVHLREPYDPDRQQDGGGRGEARGGRPSGGQRGRAGGSGRGSGGGYRQASRGGRDTGGDELDDEIPFNGG
jgi:hypothetical protein